MGHKNRFWISLAFCLPLIMMFQNCDRSNRPLSESAPIENTQADFYTQSNKSLVFLDDDQEPDFQGLNYYGYRYIPQFKTYRAGYWRDGIFNLLPVPDGVTETYLLNGKKIGYSNFIMGYFRQGSTSKPLVWKNHQLEKINSPANEIFKYLNASIAGFNDQIFFGARYETAQKSNCQNSGSYWQGSNPKTVKDSSDTIASLSALDANTQGVYFAGLSGDCQPGVWTNNVFEKLPVPSKFNQIVPSEISVANDQTIISAVGTTRSGRSNVGYWKGSSWNDLDVPLAADETLLDATEDDLFVMGNDIYILGSYSTNLQTHLGYWKNKVWTEISVQSADPVPVRLSKITVVAGKVFVTGYFSDGNSYYPGLLIDGVYKSVANPNYEVYGTVLFVNH
jgi:hypothetical protein